MLQWSRFILLHIMQLTDYARWRVKLRAKPGSFIIVQPKWWSLSGPMAAGFSMQPHEVPFLQFDFVSAAESPTALDPEQQIATSHWVDHHRRVPASANSPPQRTVVPSETESACGWAMAMLALDPVSLILIPQTCG